MVKSGGTIASWIDDVAFEIVQIVDALDGVDVLVLGVGRDALELDAVDILSHGDDHQVDVVDASLDRIRHRRGRVDVGVSVSQDDGVVGNLKVHGATM